MPGRRTRAPYRWYPPPSRPRAADGIKARSRRGDIAQTWWSQRFIEILEGFELGTRLGRGRSYARRGQVLSLDVGAGEIKADVQGSRAKPYHVRICVLTLSEKDWAKAERAIAERALFAAKLLAGEMPQNIEEAFSDCRLSLFPASARDLATDCTCPDWANPCKHVAATYYLLAEAFDADPFLVFRWRGRNRDTLLRRLRALRGGEGSDSGWARPRRDVPPLHRCLESFWSAGPDLDKVRVRPSASVDPAAILRELDAPSIEVCGVTLPDVIEKAYETIAAGAERRGMMTVEGT